MAIGDRVVDLVALEATGIFAPVGADFAFFGPGLNPFMSQGTSVWEAVRTILTDLLRDGGSPL